MKSNKAHLIMFVCLVAACTYKMSLFGDLPTAKNEPQAAGPILGTSLKKPSIAPPPSILRGKKRKPGSEAPNNVPAAGDGHSLFAAFGPIEDEYDPAVPNEYEKAKQAQEEAILEAERIARKAAQEREGADATDAPEARAGLGSGNMEGDSVGPVPGKSQGGMSVAEKLMKSMGWSQGQGLGKEKQGIATPYILQKTDARTGVIVNAEPLQPPAQVDDGLEDEIAEEVAKFGDVLRVLIFQVTEMNIAVDQAVRIFVEMDTVQGAQQAIMALNGRYFDERVVSACFFDEKRFNAMDLAPSPEELAK